MTQKAYECGIEMTLAGIFPGSQAFYLESILTKLGATNFCPICSEADFIKAKKAENAWDKLHPKAKQNIHNWQQRGK